MMMKPGEFYIYGESSIELYNTIIQDRPLINAPKRKVIQGESSGRSGKRPMDTGKYENTTMELILYSWTDGTPHYDMREKLYEIFNSGDYVELIFYFDPKKVYRVMIDEDVQFENKYFYDDGQTWKVPLTVFPWKEIDFGNERIELTKYGTVNNPYVHASKPRIEIVGKGKINLMINKKVFIMGEIPHYGIILDSEISTAYAREGPKLHNMNSYTYTREYPVLEPGDNLIEWLAGSTGTVAKVIIEPRWRSLV